MDDLISREALLVDLCEEREEGTFEFTVAQAEAADKIIRYVISRIEKLPSGPVVPLDKLCEWLAKNASWYATEIDGDPEEWKSILMEWMDENA